jgi:hypothetical protein
VILQSLCRNRPVASNMNEKCKVGYLSLILGSSSFGTSVVQTKPATITYRTQASPCSPKDGENPVNLPTRPSLSGTETCPLCRSCAIQHLVHSRGRELLVLVIRVALYYACPLLREKPVNYSTTLVRGPLFCN